MKKEANSNYDRKYTELINKSYYIILGNCDITQSREFYYAEIDKTDERPVSVFENKYSLPIKSA